jgi:hypothetical protein
LRATQFAHWLIPVAGLLALTGYFGPWVNHRVAGLVVTGLDLGEYVKFLPVVRGGQVILWREGFYLPLVAVSLTFSFVAFHRAFGYSWTVRALLLGVAIIAAANLLPPAWTPTRLLTPEFYQQGSAILICLGAVAFSPLLALLPRWFILLSNLLLCGFALWVPVRNFLRVLPDIASLYHQPLQPGWGVYGLVSGLGLLAMLCSLATLREQPKPGEIVDADRRPQSAPAKSN